MLMTPFFNKKIRILAHTTFKEITKANTISLLLFAAKIR